MKVLGIGYSLEFKTVLSDLFQRMGIELYVVSKKEEVKKALGELRFYDFAIMDTVWFSFFQANGALWTEANKKEKSDLWVFMEDFGGKTVRLPVAVVVFSSNEWFCHFVLSCPDTFLGDPATLGFLESLANFIKRCGLNINETDFYLSQIQAYIKKCNKEADGRVKDLRDLMRENRAGKNGLRYVNTKLRGQTCQEW